MAGAVGDSSCVIGEKGQRNLIQRVSTRLSGITLLVGLVFAASFCLTTGATASPRVLTVKAPARMVQGVSYIVTSVIRNPENVKATGTIRVTLSTNRAAGPWLLGQRKVQGIGPRKGKPVLVSASVRRNFAPGQYVMVSCFISRWGWTCGEPIFRII